MACVISTNASLPDHHSDRFAGISTLSSFLLHPNNQGMKSRYSKPSRFSHAGKVSSYLVSRKTIHPTQKMMILLAVKTTSMAILSRRRTSGVLPRSHHRLLLSSCSHLTTSPREGSCNDPTVDGMDHCMSKKKKISVNTRSKKVACSPASMVFNCIHQ